jgi:hypothetical protein
MVLDPDWGIEKLHSRQRVGDTGAFLCVLRALVSVFSVLSFCLFWSADYVRAGSRQLTVDSPKRRKRRNTENTEGGAPRTRRNEKRRLEALRE